MPIMGDGTRIVLKDAVTEAHRFIRAAQLALSRDKVEKENFYQSREMGAVKRASMDLSRALTEVRR